jgi:hypothetical protein
VDEAWSIDWLFVDLDLSDQLFKDNCHAQAKTLFMGGYSVSNGFFMVWVSDSYTFEQ